MAFVNQNKVIDVLQFQTMLRYMLIAGFQHLAWEHVPFKLSTSEH